MTVYRNGSMALIELNHASSSTLTLYDLKAMTSCVLGPGGCATCLQRRYLLG